VLRTNDEIYKNGIISNGFVNFDKPLKYNRLCCKGQFCPKGRPERKIEEFFAPHILENSLKYEEKFEIYKKNKLKYHRLCCKGQFCPKCRIEIKIENSASYHFLNIFQGTFVSSQKKFWILFKNSERLPRIPFSTRKLSESCQKSKRKKDENAAQNNIVGNKGAQNLSRILRFFARDS